MNLDLSHYHRDKISNLCTRYGVKRLELFGSAVHNDFDPKESDFDFLVEFSTAHPLGPSNRYFGLKEDLEQLFQRPVDLVEAKSIKNPYFRRAIEQDKVLVYAI